MDCGASTGAAEEAGALDLELASDAAPGLALGIALRLAPGLALFGIAFGPALDGAGLDSKFVSASDAEARLATNCVRRLTTGSPPSLAFVLPVATD